MIAVGTTVVVPAVAMCEYGINRRYDKLPNNTHCLTFPSALPWAFMPLPWCCHGLSGAALPLGFHNTATGRAPAVALLQYRQGFHGTDI